MGHKKIKLQTIRTYGVNVFFHGFEYDAFDIDAISAIERYCEQQEGYDKTKFKSPFAYLKKMRQDLNVVNGGNTYTTPKKNN